jgi:GNAT superfamily N-acetyltransferase
MILKIPVTPSKTPNCSISIIRKKEIPMSFPYQRPGVTPEALEQSTFRYLAYITSLPKFERRVEADVTLVSADVPVLYFNSASNIRFNGDAEQRIRETRQFFGDRSRSFGWMVSPFSAALTHHLGGHGGKFLESLPYLTVQLDRIRRDSAPPAFHSKLVRTRDMLYTWTSIYCHARAYPESTDKLFAAFSDLDLTESAPLQLVLGYLGDRPVATYSVFLDDGVAGFFSLSTLPGVRGHGIGSAISIAAADLAQDRGYRLAMLLSEHLSRNLCRRLGFEDGYGSMDVYLMSN